MAIKITTRGSFSKTVGHLERLLRGGIYSDLDRYGRLGVDALARATPVDTGRTARSWAYRIVKNPDGPGIEWYNTNPDTSGGASVAVLIQYGHGTRTGGYVPGYDYINPAMRGIFDAIHADIWKKVIV